MRYDDRQPTTTLDEAGQGDWQVIVESIGQASAGLVAALENVSTLPGSRLAELLYRAPSRLAVGLDLDTARQLHDVLEGAGLESRVLPADQPVELGDREHEIAVVVRDPSRMLDVACLVVEVLGVDVAQARRLLCAAPSVLLGQISVNTARALRRRFEALDGVEVDISSTRDATYDLVADAASEEQRLRMRRELERLGHAIEPRSGGPRLASGLGRADAEALWQVLARTGGTAGRLINRDFERFDLSLEAAPKHEAIERFLVTTAGIPESLIGKVLDRLPIVTHRALRRDALERYCSRLAALGARGVGHALSRRRYALRIDALGDLDASVRVVSALTELDEAAADAALRGAREIAGPLTHPQVGWLRWQLGRVGTKTRRVAR